MYMMTSRNLQCVDSSKTQQSKYLGNETFFPKKTRIRGDGLSVYLLNLLPEVSTLPSLVAISVVEVEI